MKQKFIIPKHIAIIMDGNRRWGKARGLSILAGHQKVANDILEPLVEYANTLGIRYITFWAFSTENWKRSKHEVQGIMRIFRHIIHDQWQRLHKKGVRIRVIGDISRFAPDIRKAMVDVVEQTKNNPNITAIFALNYGGRDEIIRAINRWHQEQSRASNVRKLSEKEFSQYLDTAGIPDPEFIVRTGGELRMSGFLIWQSEYSEFYFPTWFMPEFTPEKLDEVIAEYQRRERRFGK